MKILKVLSVLAALGLVFVLGACGSSSSGDLSSPNILVTSVAVDAQSGTMSGTLNPMGHAIMVHHYGQLGRRRVELHN